ncbi:hypothetical protein [Streptomyces calvus]|uniref:hypothetical protein n=1 Tax=Streptomyces calvus TaxID=67282 RepID=UPI0037108DBD
MSEQTHESDAVGTADNSEASGSASGADDPTHRESGDSADSGSNEETGTGGSDARQDGTAPTGEPSPKEKEKEKKDKEKEADQAASFEEEIESQQHNLIKTRRGAASAHGSATYIENMYSGGGGSAKTPVQAVSFTADIVGALHLEVPQHAEMVRMLRQRHVVVLSGEEGTGRRATALALLTEVSRPRYAVSALYRDDADVVRGVCERAEVLKEDHGYLIEAVTHPVTEQTLDRLTQLAARSGAYLVMTGVPSAFPAPDGAHVFAHQGPDARKVFEAHLKTLIARHPLPCEQKGDTAPCRGVDASRFLARVSREEQVWEKLSRARSITEVCQFARFLAENLHVAETDLGEVVGRWDDRLRYLAREMLGLNPTVGPDQGPAPYHQVFRFSYALFHEHPVSDVVEAADRLGRIMLPHFGITQDELTRHTAEHNIDRLVPKEMRAPETTGSGSSQRRALLAHPDLLDHVLEGLWTTYGRLQRPLLGWFDDLVSDPGGERIRFRVAQLVGLLMRHDFDFVYRNRVKPWAEGSAARHRCAALAMEMAAADAEAHGGSAERVLAQVQSWAGSPRTELQDSAARAYGTTLGLRDVPATLAELGRLGRKRDLARYNSVPHAMARVFLAGHEQEVTMELIQWVQARDEFLPRQAVRTMLALGRSVVSADRPDRPALAELALDDGKKAELLVAFLNRALITRETSTRAWDLLGRWLLAADAEDHQDLSNLYERLAPRIFTGPLRSRGRFQLQCLWLPSHPHSVTLRRVLGALTSGPHTTNEGIRR